MKHILIVSAVLFVALTQAWIRPCEAESIRMGYFTLRPHMYESQSGGGAKGAAVIYFEKIAAVMGYTVEWVGPLPYTRMIYYLENDGPIDGSPVMSINADRKRYLCYPKNHFYLAKPNFVVRRDNPLDRITAPDDVNGFVVGQFEKAANARFVIENKALFRMDIVSTGNLMMEQQLKKLIAGRIDAIHTLDEYTLMFEAKRLKLDQMVKILLLPEPAWPFYSAFSKSKNGDNLAREYDLAFDASGYKPEDYHDIIQEAFDQLTTN